VKDQDIVRDQDMVRDQASSQQRQRLAQTAIAEHFGGFAPADTEDFIYERRDAPNFGESK
jgi:hypothetical protein